jgi:urease accessory protein
LSQSLGLIKMMAIISIPMSTNNSAPHLQNPSLLKLMRLTSPSLPIGGYSYSQGLEFAISTGWVHDTSTASDWIQGLLKNSLINLDLPVLQKLYEAWQESDTDRVRYWNNFLSANRDAFELQEEDRQLGKALARLLVDLNLEEAKPFLNPPYCGFLTLYGLAVVRWNISLNDAAHGFLWMWAENKVLCAMKLIPLGQTDGQKILSAVIETISRVVNQGLDLSDEDIGYTALGQGIASALHETQYTRLFRS